MSRYIMRAKYNQNYKNLARKRVVYKFSKRMDTVNAGSESKIKLLRASLEIL